MKAVPLSLKEANEYIKLNHRHHGPVVRDKYRVGAEKNGKLVGVVQVGRPVSRYLDDGKTVEVLRLCTDGTCKNVCSFLYSKAARIAKELGYSKIITYILKEEHGTSLKTSGWICEGEAGGGSWDCKSRPREIIETQMSLFPQKQKYPTGKKQRWARFL